MRFPLRRRSPQSLTAAFGAERLWDVLRQVAIFAAAYYAYRLTRGTVHDPQGTVVAFEHARHIMGLERSIGVFVEEPVQELTSAWQPLLDVASWIYLNAQTTVVFGALAYIYAFHNERYYFVRNMMIIAMGVALVGYVIYPTAPPRFFPEWGFHDSVAAFTGVDANDVKVNALFNPYAAVPSMHVGNAALLGASLARLCRSRLARSLWAAYPLVMVWVVLATANHWTSDALAGAATALVAFQGARWLAHMRPRPWAFAPARTA